MIFYIQEKAKKVVVIGGGYIGMEVAAAAAGWNLDTTVSCAFSFLHGFITDAY